jgi:integrase
MLMHMHQRGTTLTIRRDADPQRKAPWGVFWNVYQNGVTGRPKQKSMWFATEAEAEEFKRLTQAALTAPTPPPAPVSRRSTDSLAVLAQDWLAHVEDQREAATHRSYQGLVTHYLAPAPGHKRYPGLGNHIVDDRTFTPKVIADFLTRLHRDGVSLSMRRRAHRGLSAFCTYARFAGRLAGASNPCKDLGRLIRRKGEEDAAPAPNPFTPDEITRIFDQLGAVEDDWVPYYQFLLDVGVRVGEAAALKWTALDLAHHKARIELSYSTVALTDKLPKSHERRTVDLTARVVEQLLKWRVVQRQAAFRCGRPQPEYVFTSRNPARTRAKGLARRIPDGNMRFVFARVMQACAITGHTPHDFRDTFATSHLVEAWDRKLGWVSKQLGHQSPTTTMTYYYNYRDTSASRGFADEIRAWEK